MKVLSHSPWFSLTPPNCVFYASLYYRRAQDSMLKESELIFYLIDYLSSKRPNDIETDHPLLNNKTEWKRREKKKNTNLNLFTSTSSSSSFVGRFIFDFLFRKWLIGRPKHSRKTNWHVIHLARILSYY